MEVKPYHLVFLCFSLNVAASKTQVCVTSIKCSCVFEKQLLCMCVCVCVCVSVCVCVCIITQKVINLGA